MDILSALKTEASKLQQQLDGLNSAIGVLGAKNGVGRGRRRKWHMSASAKARIAKAQRARWRKIKAAKKM